MSEAVQLLRQDSGSLWDEAVNSLDDDLKAGVDLDKSEVNALEDLLILVEERRKALDDRSWSFKRKSGEKVMVRDILAKVTKWANHFKAVGDVASSFDPQHAALPWAGVRFLLHVATSDLNTYSQLVEATATIAESICRNALVEALLKDTDYQNEKEPRNALVKLYASILSYLTKAGAYYSESTFRRILKTGFLASSELSSAFDTITQAQEDVNWCTRNFGLEVQLQTRDDLRVMLETLDAPVRRWNESFEHLSNHIDATRRREILESISSQPYKQHHSRETSEVMPGTGTWLLQHSTYVQWKNDSASSILWLHGIPGSGKSKLTSIVVEDSLAAYQRKQAPAPAYFYCSRNPSEPERSDSSKILASIARQLAEPENRGPLLKAAVDVYEELHGGLFSLDAIRNFILRLLESYKSSVVTIIIDALDECQELSQGPLLDSSAQGMFRWASLQLEALCQQRTDNGVLERLGRLPKTLKALYQEIMTRIESFEAISERQLAQTALSWLLCGKRRFGSETFLLAVSGATEELSRDQVLDLCCNLVIYDNNMDTFRFSHLSVQEFLGEHVSYRQASAHALLAEACLMHMLQSPCFPTTLDPFLEYSCDYWAEHAQEAGEEREGRLRPIINEFLSGDQDRHSCFTQWHEVVWGPHRRWWLEPLLAKKLKLATSSSWRPSVLLLICAFDLSGVLSTTQWMECFERNASRWGPTLPEVAAECGSCDIIAWIAHHKLPFEITPRVTLNAASCLFGDGKVMKLLLDEYGSDIRLDSHVVDLAASNWVSGAAILTHLFDFYGKNLPITSDTVQLAATNEKTGKEILEVLFTKGGKSIKVSQELVLAAARYRNCDMMALLLDLRKDEVRINEEVVEVAAQLGCRDTMTLLLDKRGADIKITEYVVRAVAANETGQDKKIMSLLLERRGDEMEISQNVLHSAARRLHTNMMALLLRERRDKIRLTPDVIKVAIRDRNSSMMELLLDVYKQDLRVTKEVIRVSAQHGAPETMALLLDRRPELHITEEDLEASAQNRSPETMAVLLDRRPELRVTKEVVRAVAQYGTAETAKLLLRRRPAEFHITEDDVRAMSKRGSFGENMVSVILNNPEADFQVTERTLETVSQWGNAGTLEAVLGKCSNNIPITEAILKIAANDHLYGREKIALLAQRDLSQVTIAITEEMCWEAARNGAVDIFYYLCQLAPFPVSLDWLDIALFRHAVKMDDPDSVIELLEHRVRPDIPSTRGETPLWLAARLEHTEIVRILLKEDVDVNALTSNGESPLFWPSAWGCEEIVKLLLDAGTRTWHVDERGWTALSMAERKDHKEVVQMILDAREVEAQSGLVPLSSP
ncbi:ankyrin repeat [Fusarium albosuccineum]|uniref:Ankyrin repeat n=1 Tax=Fusarium albosuccineum TaxID=1237068 RepID=A0A8H4LK07_9HYPO|nr:ankyrin repeat [Fusarium albosuccineum]